MSASFVMVSSVAAVSTLLSMQGVLTRDAASTLIQRLVEQEPLRPLALRTVLEAMRAYDALKGFVVNILQRLASRRLWELATPHLWDDYLACCLHTMPNAAVIVTAHLPIEVVRDHMRQTNGVKLRQSVLKHIATMTHQQVSYGC